MRLIDADAEIARIEQEIERYRKRIKEWEDNRNDRGLHDVDAIVKGLKRNIIEAKIEIRTLKNYQTAYDADKVVQQFDSHHRDYYYDEAIDIVRSGGIKP